MYEKYGIDNNNEEYKDMILFSEAYNGFDSHNYTNSIAEYPQLPARLFMSGMLHEHHEDTIKENKKLLFDFCEYLNNTIPQVKIYFLFIPRHISMEIALKPHLKMWKEEIYDVLNELGQKYGSQVIDLKNETSISANHRFYNDVNHLNNIGAIALRDVLISQIYRE